MPRRTQKEAVAKRAQQILAEQTERRRLSAQVAAGTRRQRRAQQQAEGQRQSAADRRTQTPTPRRSRPAEKAPRKERKPRVHADLLTIAFRGPLAGKFREMAERYQMTLTRLLQDALLAYESNVATGYRPGTALTEWTAQQTGEGGSA